MLDPDLDFRINDRLTAAGLGDRFELRLRNGDWEYCTGLDIDAATVLRDQLTAWIDSATADRSAVPAQAGAADPDPNLYVRDVTWGGGK
jgi:hypothetical protein